MIVKGWHLLPVMNLKARNLTSRSLTRIRIKEMNEFPSYVQVFTRDHGTLYFFKSLISEPELEVQEEE